MENQDSKKVVKITEKQKAARTANLEKGRAKKKELAEKKKEAPKHEEYEIGSDDEYEADESSEEETFTISKQKSKQAKSKPSKETKPSREGNLKNKVDALENMIMQLATLQKKQNTKRKESSRPKISVILPTQPQPNKETKKENRHYDAQIASLQERLGL